MGINRVALDEGFSAGDDVVNGAFAGHGFHEVLEKRDLVAAGGGEGIGDLADGLADGFEVVEEEAGGFFDCADGLVLSGGARSAS